MYPGNLTNSVLTVCHDTVMRLLYDVLDVMRLASRT